FPIGITIDMTLGGERHVEMVEVVRITIGMARLAGEFENDVRDARRHCCLRLLSYQAPNASTPMKSAKPASTIVTTKILPSGMATSLTPDAAPASSASPRGALRRVKCPAAPQSIGCCGGSVPLSFPLPSAPGGSTRTTASLTRATTPAMAAITASHGAAGT